MKAKDYLLVVWGWVAWAFVKVRDFVVWAWTGAKPLWNNPAALVVSGSIALFALATGLHWGAKYQRLKSARPVALIMAPAPSIVTTVPPPAAIAPAVAPPVEVLNAKAVSAPKKKAAFRRKSTSKKSWEMKGLQPCLDGATSFGSSC